MSDTALRLADEYRASMNIDTLHHWAFDAATELRRLHAEHIELGKALARAIERNNELEAELAEQARLNGMGGEREARLMAVNAELVEALNALLNDVGRANSMLGAVKARAALAKSGVSNG